MEAAEVIKKFLANSSWVQEAKAFINDKEKMQNLLNRFKEFFNNSSLEEIKDNMKEAFNYVSDVFSGRYKDYSMTALITLVAGMVYVVSPIDIIPDFIPIVGFTDDITVFLFVLKSVNDELERYRKSK
jgi:uncharacterized membrane protein YkvA (DUF1232 family)